MQQQSDYTYNTPYYPQNPNPNPISTDLHHQPPPTYASAPPFSTTPTYHPPPSDYYPPYPQSIPDTNPQFEPPSHTQPPYDYQTPPPSSIPHNPITLNPNQFPYNNSSNIPSQVPSQVPSLGYGSNYDANYGGNYNRSPSDLGLGFGGVDYYGKRAESSGGYGDGVYAYQGGKVEPYGSRGTSSKSSTWKEPVLFDDFGRPIGVPGGKESVTSAPKIVKAVPKAETREDVKGGVQKFRVKLLAESGGQSTMDVLCQNKNNIFSSIWSLTKETSLTHHSYTTMVIWQFMGCYEGLYELCCPNRTAHINCMTNMETTGVTTNKVMAHMTIFHPNVYCSYDIVRPE